MDQSRIAELLAPFLGGESLSAQQIEQLARYLDLLMKWNAKTNLTAVRDEESIVTRHIGESLFAAQHLFPPSAERACTAIDLGSGAGFPGVPLKIYAPEISMTLIESQNKKATFLKEAIRALGLRDIGVFNGRAESFPGKGGLVTLRAVEHFEEVLPIAASLLQGVGEARSGSGDLAQLPSGGGVMRHSEGLAAEAFGRGPRIGLLIGDAQVERAKQILPLFFWQEPIPVPQSSTRVLLIGTAEQRVTSVCRPCE